MFGPDHEEILKQGAVIGALTFVAGVLLVAPLLLVGGGPLAEQAHATPVAMAAFGWLVLHAWSVLFGLPPTALLLAVVPGGLLTATGYLVAWRTAHLEVQGRYRGAAVTAGYLPATAIAFGYSLLRFQATADTQTGVADLFVSLDPGFVVASVGYTGLLFPVIFGGLGGYLVEVRGE